MTEDLRTAPRLHDGPPSPRAAAAQALSRLTDLGRQSLQMQASLARQSVDLTWTALAGDLDRTSANKAYVASVSRETIRYWRTIAELGVDYATDLVMLGRSVSATVLREVAAAGRRHRIPGAPHNLEDSTGGTGATGSTPHLVAAEDHSPGRRVTAEAQGPRHSA